MKIPSSTLPVISILVGAAASYFYFSGELAKLQEELDLLENAQVINYGVLSSVNRVELETASTEFNCKHTNTDGIGKGTIRYFWDFEHAYGVDVPSSFKWELSELDETSAEITVPALVQLRPVKIEFSDFDESNQASGNRWEKMYRHVITKAKERTVKAGNSRLISDSNLWIDAEKSMANLLLPLINQVRTQHELEPLEALRVKFEGKPKSIKGKLYLGHHDCDK